MKINKQKLIVILYAAFLIIFIPLVAAAPLGTTESAVVDAAKGWIGVKEVHGGDNRSGIDCSHLVYEVYKEAGASSIVFQTVPNMKKNKYYVTTTSPTPGDVIFWKKDVTENNKTYWLATHVGIYIGSGQFIHSDRKVTIDSISGIYQEGMPYYSRWEPDGSSSNLPVAEFSASPSSGNAPLNVLFTDKSIGATSWSWIFGDGSTSTEKDPVHTYSTPGSYRVNLTVSNADGSDSQFETIKVLEKPVPILPTANFSSNPVSGFAPLEVHFTDTSQNEAGWNWDFGDGYTSTEQNPTHTFFSAATYTVNLTVSNANGINSKLATITVSEPLPQSEPVHPVANFNANPTSGYVPLTVQFTDNSQNGTGWSWDFGDGSASNEQSPTHIYYVEGTYNVNLVMSNENGTSSQTATITVQSLNSSGGESNSEGSSDESSSDSSSDSSSSGGSSSGGSSSGSSSGGGAGGSPELQSNVEAKELSQIFIASGKPIKFEFPQKVTPVVNVSFDSKKTVGKATTIAEMLKNRSILTSDTPTDEVYKYINIWVGNGGFGDSKNIENAVVCFKVEKSWIRDNKIDKSSINLNRYSDLKWNVLPTNLSGEAAEYLYFTGETPGFSQFVITGKLTSSETISANQAGTQALPEIGSLKSNASNATNGKITPEQTQSSSTKIPGFEIASVIVCLSGVFLYKRR
jgi:PGF-pre-PGF domain-containing protein